MDGPLANLHPLYKQLTGNFDFNQQDFDRVVFENKIFEIVAPTHEFQFFYDYVQKYNNKYVRFAILGSLGTSDKNKPRQEEILKQKNSWLDFVGLDKDEVPRYFVSNKKYKAMYAAANTHLIDDTPSNINQFIEAGGSAILHTPDTWQDSLNYIDKVVEETKNKTYHFIY
jgi:hypothetical protein